MTINLKDNAPIPEKYRGRCSEIHKLANDQKRRSLINLLDTPGKKARDNPQIFKDGANGDLWTGSSG